MYLEQFYYLLMIDKQKSITKAANELFISQSSLSMALQNFEKEMQMTIFKRTNNGVYLTDDGKIILEFAKNILNEVESLKSFSQQRKEQFEGRIRILSVPLWTITIMPNVINEVLKEAPNLEIKIMKGSNLDCNIEILNDLSQDRIDIGIVAYTEFYKPEVERMAKTNRLSLETILKSDLAAYVKSGHPLLGHGCLCFEEVKRNKCYPFLASKPFFTKILQHYFGENTRLISLNEFENIEKLLLKDNYILLSQSLFEFENEHIKSGRIEKLDMTGSELLEMHMDYALARSSEDVLSPAMALVVNALKRTCNYFK